MVPYLDRRRNNSHNVLEMFVVLLISLLGAEEELLQRVDVCHLLEQRVPPSVVSLRWRGHAAAVTGL